MNAIAEPRGRNVLLALTWVTASLATALAAHAAIDVLAPESGGHAHERYAHLAIVPALFAACALASATVIWVTIRRIAGSRGVDPVLAFAEHLESTYAWLSCVAVIGGGLATLVAMECCEQYAQFGHITGFADALGGNAPFGTAAVTLVGSLATILALRFAGAIVATAVTTLRLALSWFVPVRRCATIGLSLSRRMLRPREIHASVRFSRSLGLRAPPHSLR